MSDLLEFRHLKYLIAVGEEANISRAAKRLYLAQPSLSTQIKSLEEALLIPLLVRGRKGIEITPAAAILITGAHEILKLRDELIATARAVQRTHLEPLRLGFSPFVDHALLQMVCETHKSLFPDCEIMPKNGSHIELLSLLENGEIDAALLTLPVSRTDMAACPFTHRRLMVCMKANDPLASRREVSPSELEDKLTIFREPKQHPEGHRQLMEMLEAVNIRSEVAKTTATPHDLQWMPERDHLRVGDHVVRVLTMKEAITETRPLVLDALLKISANFYVVTEWAPLPVEKARKEVNKRRRHFNMSKAGFVSQIGNDTTRTNPRDVLVDESKQADIENLGDCLRALGDGQSLGDFSLTIVLYGKSKAELDQLVGEFTGVFTNADGNLFAETYNQLNAYFATVPGNYALNLRKLYLLNSNYADLSFLFTILPGEKTNQHLGTEYLAVLETDNSTPYFLNLHNGEVAHTLILGMTGSGKSYLCNFLLQSAQKYAPLTFIFDIGNSFQSLTTICGGSYLNVGQDTRDFTINPFSLAPTKENLQFLFSLFRVLIEGRDQRYRLDFKEERRLWDAIERVYVLEPEERTVSNFANIVGELKERLHRWTKAGQYGFVFDNREDTLSFSRFQTFNFAGWSDAPDVLEPLLFYVLHRASNEIDDPKKLATFKLFLMDEAWLFIRNETIRGYIVQAQKTWRKHNAAMVLSTQSIKELEQSGMLQIVSESCPTKIFLANPEMDRELYRESFHLNDTELELIAGLVPPGQMLIRKAQSSKKVQLNVDSVTHWTATNNAPDNLRKREYFERFGIADGLRHLAEEYPGHSYAVSSSVGL